MTGYRLTPAAQRDLSSIWDYTEAHRDVRQAERCIGEIRAAVERVAEDPRRGRACDEIRAGYRRYGIGGHLLFFVESAYGIDVVRILHQRMDPSLHL
ncbi:MULTISPECIES: type II toxin-antitoxin system RelE/ParE family toxin [Dietzia]|uniref:Toxin n=1 Tax=Dietzia cinnamea TaxID=321318 RepID=A0AAW5QC19_9ACTN|nr:MULTISPECIES: type II toxin-antitoxin system RelE/ParE family toxin [Dietzia]PWD95607.1 type II toxin-antitoxin system RelE/ParE family toxin [Dietzia maris]MBM7231968.1 type II toxin-antitoxin system RelE/ParE family toxin [Dietzia cinnamea]MCT1865458.1 type II toxin-antitoxin system RelE/ParE family toxin [Dietzia cinnamea]MCT2028858.1 type II toxin-antitoxin system RelE/ParE family toxin [Dietzia cinnamea]MCT2034877.1 type II toxin-antitoxin system RelE/ParE family toxin [Dietzia cinname